MDAHLLALIQNIKIESWVTYLCFKQPVQFTLLFVMKWEMTCLCREKLCRTKSWSSWKNISSASPLSKSDNKVLLILKVCKYPQLISLFSTHFIHSKGLVVQTVETRTLDLRVCCWISGARAASFTHGENNLPPISSLYPGVSRYQFNWGSFQR